MKVEYLDHLGSDLSIVNAARVSFDKHHAEFDEDGDTRLISYLAREGHFTPFAHPQITLRITAPIFVARQLVKHQIGLVWSEISRRYVDSPPEFYIPDEWRSRPENGIKQGSGDKLPPKDSHSALSIYQYLLNEAESAYHDLLAIGVAPEQARMVLPLSTYTSWIWTGSLAAYARVCNLRLDSHAQAETRDIARQIDAIIAPLFPVAWPSLMDAS